MSLKNSEGIEAKTNSMKRFLRKRLKLSVSLLLALDRS
ncbi:hypothetical protein LEP1GSC170_2547 [Leptospira interrogans serovar Bataviae str. HAI135]|uniref:Uncharacterized protein n=1 Tax=Leptospira noguchii serovar Autumnalis str. ZUN142 TaxID=1085540 RepID=M6UBU6_9LEPT|nr:hypothetical protein LEP1GSC170_2547 [Leptospira interrogans serovar Bataviae str. HAI135]EMO40421.1 hypothetical protein LEP1GSC186_0951 [Leptospira noguchii serovar Autumnalis str. ZUN142]